MQKHNPQKKFRKPKKQQLPGSESEIQPQPVYYNELFLASNDNSSYIMGQVLYPNGGEIING